MSENELETSDKIIEAAVGLIEEKGLHSVRMKEIATAAGISEMTVFRHFSSKVGLLETIVKKYSYVPALREIFEKKLIWELEADLLLISETYQKIMFKNKSLVLIILQERTLLPANIMEEASPYYFKDFMRNYFKEMQTKGKLATQEIDALVLAFMSMNFGYFLSKAVLSDKFINVSDETYIDICVQLFAKSLRP